MKTGCIKLVNTSESAWRINQAEQGAEATIIQLAVPVPSDGGRVFFVEGTVVREGVWNGMYESAAVLRAAAQSALGKFVLLDHLEEGSQPGWVDVALGQVVGVSVEGDDAATKLLIAMWENRVSPAMMEKLNNGERLGISAGLYGWYDEKTGNWNGKDYSVVATKLYHSHVAIVPVGACTIEDGCEAHLLQHARMIKLNGKKADEKNQAEAVEGPEDETPPPLFKSPDELKGFVETEIKNENPELRDKQLLIAFDFVMNTVTGNGWRVIDQQDAEARAAAMADFCMKAADLWNDGNELFQPEGQTKTESGENMNQNQNQKSKDWKGGSKPINQAQEPPKATFFYPEISQTEDGKIEYKLNQTEDENAAKAAIDATNGKLTEILAAKDKALADIQPELEKGKQAEDFARGILIGDLKKANPKISDTSIERYKVMPLEDLHVVVSDVNASLAEALGAGAGGVPAAAGAGGVNQSPTAIRTQQINDGSGKRSTFKAGMARLNKELGRKGEA